MNVVLTAIVFLQTSVFLVVFSLGLQARLGEAVYLLKRPGLMARSLLAMNLVMPAIAVLMTRSFHLDPAIKVTLILLAASPVPPILTRKQLKVGGDANYVHGLLITAAILSIVLVPVSIEIIDRIFQRQAHMGIAPIAKLMFGGVLLPIVAGMLVRDISPSIAKKISEPLAMTGFLILIFGALVLLSADLPGMASLIGNGSVFAFTAFVIIGLAVGHVLGGPKLEHRSALALATASRHPGVALAIIASNFPAGRGQVTAAILLYLTVRLIVEIPYNFWCQRSASKSNVSKQAGQARAA